MVVDFDVYGSTDQANSNLLPAGRYQFTVVEINDFLSKKGNFCVKVKLDIETYHLTDIICIAEKIDWRWRQFLYAIGIRRPDKHFKISQEEIVGKTGMVDVVQKDRELDDGTSILENRIRMYSPIEEQVAPVAGVEPEAEFQPEQTKEQKQEQPKEQEYKL
jgi:hypothetical protein